MNLKKIHYQEVIERDLLKKHLKTLKQTTIRNLSNIYSFIFQYSMLQTSPCTTIELRAYAPICPRRKHRSGLCIKRRQRERQDAQISVNFIKAVGGIVVSENTYKLHLLLMLRDYHLLRSLRASAPVTASAVIHSQVLQPRLKRL